MITPCVVDASVGIKLFLNEEDSEIVADLFADHLANTSAQLIAVPGFFFVECTSILRKAVRLNGYDAAQARSDIADLVHMGLYTIPTDSLVGTAFEIASVYGASAYDSCYVALSDQLGVPLLTADTRLINCLQGSPYSLMTVADYLATVS